ncbi:MAG TPA: aminotransferase class I/II-fold pyridoxal phosphate-dependent enzyme [Acidobacteriota bacterium]
MSANRYRLETQTVHAGEPSPRIGGAATVPIFQSSVYELTEGAGYHDIVYPRLNNLPNHTVLARKLAALESGEDGLVTASGMAAITTSLLTVLGQGGHLLTQSSLYGGTHNFVTEDLKKFGLSYDFIDAHRPESWAAKLRPNTRAIYTEALTNPLIEVADHRAVVAFAREHKLVSLIDNTFATPVNFRPLELGYDLSLHSATKYLNGHADLAAGAVIGPAELVSKIRHSLNHLGGCLDPHSCYLLNRGLRTLVLRVRQQNSSARAIAHFLDKHPRVLKVNYPSLESHPQHELAQELFQGFGGVLSFDLEGGTEAARRMIDRVKLPLHGPSLGGTETLIIRPAVSSHAGMSREDRESLGIGDGLVRLSVGIEASEDLIEDLDQALQE